MSMMDQIPKICVSKQSLNQSLVDGFIQYNDHVKVVFDWFIGYQKQTLDRIEKVRAESELHANEMTLNYQVSLLIKMTDILMKLEDIRLRYLDKCIALDLPSAPDLQRPEPEKKTNPELRGLAELVLICKQKYGIPVQEIIEAWTKEADAVLKAQEANRSANP